MLRDSIAKFFKVDSVLSNLSGYVETRIELLKIEAKEELSKGLSNLLVYILLAFVFTLVLTFASIAVGMEMSERLGGLAGFGIVAGFYLLVGAVLFFVREKLIKKLENKFSSAFKKKRK